MTAHDIGDGAEKGTHFVDSFLGVAESSTADDVGTQEHVSRGIHARGRVVRSRSWQLFAAHLTGAAATHGTPPEHGRVRADLKIAAALTLEHALAFRQGLLCVELVPDLQLLGIQLPLKRLGRNLCPA